MPGPSVRDAASQRTERRRKKLTRHIKSALVLFLLASRLGAQQLEIHYINVGWGGAVWVKGPDGTTVLLEAGDTGKGTGRVVPYLQHQGLFPAQGLDYTIAGHQHCDHIGGLPEVINAGYNVRIQNYYNGSSYSSGCVDKWNAVAPTTSAGALVAAPVGGQIALGNGAKLTFVARNGNIIGGGTVAVSDENDRSIALLIQYGGFDYLWASDLGGGSIDQACTGRSTDQTDVETSVIRAISPGGAFPLISAGGIDVLHVNHHGSESSTNRNWMNLSRPAVAVIGVGSGQTTGWDFPRVEVVEHVLLAQATACITAPPALVLQTEEGAPIGSHTSLAGYAVGNIKISTDGVRAFTVTGDGQVSQGPNEAGLAALPLTLPLDDAPGVSSPTQFVPVPPCRIADTRNPNGPFGGPAIAGNTFRDFVIPNGACGIPSNAAGYSVNVAVVPHGTLGFLTLWPSGQPQPLVATLNSIDGRVKSNAAIVPAGLNGAVSVFATDTADVILDVNGYFVAGNSPSAMAFYPLTPCHIADTRNATGPLGGPSLAAQSTRSFPILASQCGLPPSAQAYSLNFAAVPKGPTLGFLTAWPAGQPRPTVASLNDPAGTVLSNAVVVPAGANGDVSVFATDATDLVIDINGYFAPQGQGGLSLYTMTPCRVLDSRLPTGTPPFNTIRDVNVTASPCGVPTTAQAFVFNATVVPPGFLGFITMWQQGQNQPLAATLNAYDGVVANNMAIVPTTTGSISVFPSAPTHLVLDLFGYFAP